MMPPRTLSFRSLVGASCNQQLHRCILQVAFVKPSLFPLQLDNTAKVLVDELSELMCKLMDTFDARGLANATWAFGKLKYVPSQKLPAQIAAASVGKIRQFSAQNLSNMLWSFVYLHYRNEELLQAAAEQVGDFSQH